MIVSVRLLFVSVFGFID